MYRSFIFCIFIGLVLVVQPASAQTMRIGKISAGDSWTQPDGLQFTTGKLYDIKPDWVPNHQIWTNALGMESTNFAWLPLLDNLSITEHNIVFHLDINAETVSNLLITQRGGYPLYSEGTISYTMTVDNGTASGTQSKTLKSQITTANSQSDKLDPVDSVVLGSTVSFSRTYLHRITQNLQHI